MFFWIKLVFFHTLNPKTCFARLFSLPLVVSPICVLSPQTFQFFCLALREFSLRQVVLCKPFGPFQTRHLRFIFKIKFGLQYPHNITQKTHTMSVLLVRTDSDTVLESVTSLSSFCFPKFKIFPKNPPTVRPTLLGALMLVRILQPSDEASFWIICLDWQVDIKNKMLSSHQNKYFKNISFSLLMSTF